MPQKWGWQMPGWHIYYHLKVISSFFSFHPGSDRRQYRNSRILGPPIRHIKVRRLFLFHNLSLMLLLGSPNSSKKEKNHTNVNSNFRSEMLRAVLESIAFSQKQLVRTHLVDFVIYKVRSRLKHLEKVYVSKFLT